MSNPVFNGVPENNEARIAAYLKLGLGDGPLRGKVPMDQYRILDDNIHNGNGDLLKKGAVEWLTPEVAGLYGHRVEKLQQK